MIIEMNERRRRAQELLLREGRYPFAQSVVDKRKALLRRTTQMTDKDSRTVQLLVGNEILYRDECWGVSEIRNCCRVIVLTKLLGPNYKVKAYVPFAHDEIQNFKRWRDHLREIGKL